MRVLPITFLNINHNLPNSVATLLPNFSQHWFAVNKETQALFYMRQLTQLSHMNKQDKPLNPGAVCLILDKLDPLTRYPILGLIQEVSSGGRSVTVKYLTKRGGKQSHAVASRSTQGLCCFWEPKTDTDTDTEVLTFMG